MVANLTPAAKQLFFSKYYDNPSEHKYTVTAPYTAENSH